MWNFKHTPFVIIAFSAATADKIYVSIIKHGDAYISRVKFIKRDVSRWCHKLEMFSASLALCAGKSPVNGEFPSERPVMRSFDVFLSVPEKNDRVNNRKAGDLRRHRAHYYVTVMLSICMLGRVNIGCYMTWDEPCWHMDLARPAAVSKIYLTLPCWECFDRRLVINSETLFTKRMEF